MQGLASRPNEPVRSEGASHANELSAAFRQAADDVLPCVVTIENRPIVSQTSMRETPRGIPGGQAFPWGDFFGDSDMRRFFEQGPSPTPQTGTGSGVVIDKSGLILTNNHVVAGGGEVLVRFSDGREFVASEVRTDPRTDLAIVRIEGAGDLPAARTGDSDESDIGDWVLALGQPFGLEGTVTAGIISAKGRGIGITDREDFIQTDAAINPGNSGGPLVNLDGEVIGINTAISSRSGGNQGIGFAVPINLAEWVADQLADGGTVHRAYLGVGIQSLTPSLAEQLGVQVQKGVLVADVREGSPAAEAGMQSGDVVTKFDGREVATTHELQAVVEMAKIGELHRATVLRDGKSVELKVVCREMPADVAATGSQTSDSAHGESRTMVEKFGFQAADLDEETASHLGLRDAQGVVITAVDSGSVAERAGLREGVAILSIDRQPVNSTQELSKALQEVETGKGALLLVRDAQATRFVVLKPAA